MPFDLIEEAKRVIGIPSESARGNEPLVDHLKSIVAPLDFTVTTQPVAVQGATQVNFIAEKGPASGDAVLFVTHLDTVPPGDPALWTECGGDPLRATVKGDDLYGLGSADAKIDVLCKLKAAERFVGVPFRRRLTILGSFGEEIGLLGARHFLEEPRIPYRYAVIGEPSDLEVVTAHKGYIVWLARLLPASEREFPPPNDVTTVVFRGKEAHSSTPELGENAIERGFSASISRSSSTPAGRTYPR